MNDPLSIHELCSLLEPKRFAHPEVDTTAAGELGEIGQLIETLGLPSHFADWFKCTDVVVPFPNANGVVFSLAGVDRVIRRCVLIGRNDVGAHVIDCDTGCVVYVESSGATQLINTSLERFLYFVGSFDRSSKQGFANIGTLRMDLERIDSSALVDAEGVWAFMLEEAEAGLY